jgi:hypothetical protein
MTQGSNGNEGKTDEGKMTVLAENLRRSILRFLLPGMIVVGAGCEKPKLRSDSAKESIESTPATKPVNPFSRPAPAPGQSPAEPAPMANPSPATTVSKATASPAAPPTLDAAGRAREYARLQKMLEAQLVGIRSLESDLSRHSASLTQLRNQLQLTRSLQAGAGSGGIRIERVGGESSLVDRKTEARELEMKIRAEEPFVAQLSAALQGARRQYDELRRTAEDLIRE